MRSHLIFYKQNSDTSVSETIVRGVLARFGLELDGVDKTFDYSDFSYVLSQSVMYDEIIFIVGGLDLMGGDNIIRVLSNALSIPTEEAGLSRAKYIIDKAHGMPQPSLMGSEIFRNRIGGPDGCAIRSGIQCIICLPDNQAQLSDMLAGSGAAYFASVYGLSELEIINRHIDEPLVEIRPGELTSIMETTLNLSELGKNYHEDKPEEPVKVHHKKKMSIGGVLLRIGIVAVIFGMILSILYVGFQSYSESAGGYTAKMIYTDVKKLYNQSNDTSNLPEGVLEKYSLLLKQNEDTAGWFSIPGTPIAFPVMQSPKNNPDFYKDHDFNKNENTYGALWLDKNYNSEKDSINENTVIYGNSPADGQMLSPLANYTNIEYFTNHPIIEFDSLYTEQMWRVFSVAILSSNTIEGFNYSDNSFIGEYAKEEHLYELFIRSMFYTQVDVFPTDNLLTIITDSDEFSGAKLIICARAVRDDEDLTDLYSGIIKNPFVLMPDIWYDMTGEKRPEIPGFEYASEVTTTTTTTVKTTSTTLSSTNSTKTTATKTTKTTKNDNSSTKKTTTKTTTVSPDKNVKPKSGLTMRITSKGRIIEDSAEKVLAMIIEAEMGGSFHKEALKAQAVAAYTFYLYSGGAAKAPSFPTKSNYTKACLDAAKSVVGIKMQYKGKAPYACYHAISAGRTANNADVFGRNLPYLVSVDCSVDEKVSGFETVKKYSASDIAARVKSKTGVDLSGVDKSKWFKITKRDSNDLYVKKVSLGGKKEVSGYKIYSSIFGGYKYVRSSAFWITYDADSDTFTFRSRGYGHCVGMSQKGANQYAKQGKSYQWILKHFYTGVSIV